jgi:hypothetical protein
MVKPHSRLLWFNAPVNGYAELAIHFAEVAAQKESEAVDRDLSTASLLSECCQDSLRGAKTAAAALETEEEDLDEDLDEVVSSERCDGPILEW